MKTCKKLKLYLLSNIFTTDKTNYRYVYTSSKQSNSIITATNVLHEIHPSYPYTNS